jgi:hypothetical protein
VDALIGKGQTVVLSSVELADLESLIARKVASPACCVRMPFLAAEYASLSDERDNPHVLSMLCKKSDVDHSSCGANYFRLLTEVVRLRRVRRALGIMRNVLCAISLFAFVMHIAIGVAFLNLLSAPREVPMPLVLMLVGGLGGLVSGVGRLYQLRWSGDFLSTYRSVRVLGASLGLNILLCYIEGVIFALLLYVAFQAGLMKGSLFPEFVPLGDGSGKDGFVSLWKISPKEATDVGKAVIWAFAAGLCERIVPDIFGQLRNSVSQPASAEARHAATAAQQAQAIQG